VPVFGSKWATRPHKSRSSKIRQARAIPSLAECTSEINEKEQAEHKERRLSNYHASNPRKTTRAV
jgi:hypothetical protein